MSGIQEIRVVRVHEILKTKRLEGKRLWPRSTYAISTSGTMSVQVPPVPKHSPTMLLASDAYKATSGRNDSVGHCITDTSDSDGRYAQQ